MIDGGDLPASVTGKPLSIGGTRGARGRHVDGRADRARAPPSPSSTCRSPASRAVIQGFGKVGGPLAFLLSSAGMRVVAVSDVGGAVHNAGGLDAGALSDHVAAAGSVAGLRRRRRRSTRTTCGRSPCELVVPAALGGRHRRRGRRAARRHGDRGGGQRPDHARGRRRSSTRRGIVVVPDILANAGGVTASYFEWAQSRQGYAWDEETVAEPAAAARWTTRSPPCGPRPTALGARCAGPPSPSPSSGWPRPSPPAACSRSP